MHKLVNTLLITCLLKKSSNENYLNNNNKVNDEIYIQKQLNSEKSKINKLSNDNSQTGKFLIDTLHLENVTAKTI